MGPSSSHHTDRTTSRAGFERNSPMGLIWIIVPLVVVLLLGALIAITYHVVTRCRRRKAGDGDPEQAATGHSTATLQMGDAIIGGSIPVHGTRLHNTTPESTDSSQPTNRWGWVFEPSSRGTVRISEGLNELGEAPPPYGEDNERSKSYVAEVVEVGDGGEGPSGTALRQEPRTHELAGPAEQRRSEGGSEPPAYEMAVGSGETASIREPLPAVTPRSR